MDTYFRAYAPEAMTQKVDNWLSKRDSLNLAVKQKMGEVFDVCERIVDYYIPEEQCERPEYDDDFDVFTRMTEFSHDISARICYRFLPYLSEHIEDDASLPLPNPFSKKSKSADSSNSISNSNSNSNSIPPKHRQSLHELKERCVATVEPVVSPFSPIVTPLFSLFVLFFSTLRLLFRTLIMDPLSALFAYLSTLLQSTHQTLQTRGNAAVTEFAADLWQQARTECVSLFTDENGKVSLAKFQERCGARAAAYQQLLQERVTAGKLLELFGETRKQLESAQLEGNRHAKELVALFSDPAGKFTLSKVQPMVGKSAEELRRVLGEGKQQLEQWNEGMKRKAESTMWLLLNVVALVPTVALLVGGFALSYVMDVKTLLPKDVCMQKKSDVRVVKPCTESESGAETSDNEKDDEL